MKDGRVEVCGYPPLEMLVRRGSQFSGILKGIRAENARIQPSCCPDSLGPSKKGQGFLGLQYRPWRGHGALGSVT